MCVDSHLVAGNKLTCILAARLIALGCLLPRLISEIGGCCKYRHCTTRDPESSSLLAFVPEYTRSSPTSDDFYSFLLKARALTLSTSLSRLSSLSLPPQCLVGFPLSLSLSNEQEIDPSMAARRNTVDRMLELSTVLETSNEEQEEEKGKQQPASFEDILIGGLESLTNIFDDVYLLKNFGIIGETNFVYRHLNKGGLGSKLWLATLVLSLRKSLGQLFRLARARHMLQKERRSTPHKCSETFAKIIADKFTQKIGQLDRQIKDVLLDVLQNLAYLLVVAVDVFKLKLPHRWRRLLEWVSSLVTVSRFFFAGFSTIAV